MDAGQAHPRISLLGGEVDVITPAEMLRFVDMVAGAGGGAVVANHNAHSLFLQRRNPGLRAFFADADVVQIDSTPLIAWAAMLGLPARARHRSTYLDWREAFWPLADRRGWRVFYLGGAPGVAQRACQRLAARWPAVSLASHDGYFDTAAGSPANRAVVRAIGDFAPDILFVGMGMPRQECWIADNRAALGACVIFPLGAAFDYEAGVQPVAPRWTGRLGVEWLFRLAGQPRRLAARYLLEPWLLLPAAGRDLVAALAGRARRRS
jgi:N-acetylglucosaminyldiphosphoundecaprenol N-acetyl-beta-D-mannosaminyltransferase